MTANELFTHRFQSKGHLAFIPRNREVILRDGNVLIAPRSNAIMPDGYRTGRYETTAAKMQQIIDHFGPHYGTKRLQASYPWLNAEACRELGLTTPDTWPQ